MSKPDVSRSIPSSCDVAIIGAGPAGMATATQLKKLGITDIIVLERESEAGGVPRHCGHPPFGLREFKRCWTGPAYATALTMRAAAAGVDIYLDTTVVEIFDRGGLLISTTHGMREINARIVVLATGARETPRPPRLISGQRPLGVVTTGALQSMVYLKQKIPFKRPVIVGTELVSFSALLTCRHAGIKPVAMVESNNRVSARKFAQILPKLLGIPLHLNTELKEILGRQRVAGISVSDSRFSTRTIDCDGIIFSGQFTPESSLARIGHLEFDEATGGPRVDQYGRCSDPHYIATGNLLRPVESAGWSWREGVNAAHVAARILRKGLPKPGKQIPLLTKSEVIKYVMPQVLVPFNADCAMKHLQLRFSRQARGRLSICSGKQTMWSKNISTMPERRVLVSISRGMLGPNLDSLEIKFEERA